MDAFKQSLVVAGLNVDVYSHPSATDPSIPVHALFFLHGRGDSAQHRTVVTTVKTVFDVTYGPDSPPRKKDLIIVAFVSITSNARNGYVIIDMMDGRISATTGQDLWTRSATSHGEKIQQRGMTSMRTLRMSMRSILLFKRKLTPCSVDMYTIQSMWKTRSRYD